MITGLREAREKAGYTIEQVSSALKIRKQYVISLEEEDFANIPGKTYIEGYKKMYYEFLGLDYASQKSSSPSTSTPEPEHIRVIKQKIVILASLIMLIIVVGVYSL